MDHTLIDGQLNLIDPLTPQWVEQMLQSNDIVICTYRSYNLAKVTEETLERIGLGMILSQNIAYDYRVYPTCIIQKNIIYSTNKGASLSQFRNTIGPIWTGYYFVDDQMAALDEMMLACPDVFLYLIQS